MCFQRSSERIEGKCRLPQSGWKIVPQSRTGCRETPVAKFVVCSWHEQLPDVVGMRPQVVLTEPLYLCVFCVYSFVRVSCRSYTLNTNSLSILCIFICAPCFYRVATAIRHFMTDSWCICLIHLCKVVFINLPSSPPLLSRVTLTTVKEHNFVILKCILTKLYNKVYILSFN